MSVIKIIVKSKPLRTAFDNLKYSSPVVQTVWDREHYEYVITITHTDDYKLETIHENIK